MLGGDFTTLGGGGTGTPARNKIGRLNPDGTLDTSFNPGADDTVRTLALQADGKILVGGAFTTLGGGGAGTTTRNYFGRLNPDGSLDTSFDPDPRGTVESLAVQADGKILVGGVFTTLGGGGTGTATRNYIGRLHPDGTLDGSFDPGANSFVYALAMQADGKILAGGKFATLGGGGTGATARKYIGRLTNSEAALHSLTVGTNSATIDWNRGGASPEVDRVTLELSTDAINYVALGNATRISGGWQLTGQSLPTLQNIFIRARGFYSTGLDNGSSSIVETVRNAFIVAAPLQLATAVSRKTHGAAGNFDINLPLVGEPGVECRSTAGSHTIVFTFSNNVVSGNASVTTGTGSVLGSPSFAANSMTVNLTGVADVQKITVTLNGVTDSFAQVLPDTAVSMNMLIGDTSGNKTVNASDVGQTKGQSGAPVTGTNFRQDVTPNGTINAADIGLVKSRSGFSVP